MPQSRNRCAPIRCEGQADVAQLVERVTCNDEVRGSIPRVGSPPNFAVTLPPFATLFDQIWPRLSSGPTRRKRCLGLNFGSVADIPVPADRRSCKAEVSGSIPDVGSGVFVRLRTLYHHGDTTGAAGRRHRLPSRARRSVSCPCSTPGDGPGGRRMSQDLPGSSSTRMTCRSSGVSYRRGARRA